jgi:hypothetical protein
MHALRLRCQQTRESKHALSDGAGIATPAPSSCKSSREGLHVPSELDH